MASHSVSGAERKLNALGIKTGTDWNKVNMDFEKKLSEVSEKFKKAYDQFKSDIEPLCDPESEKFDPDFAEILVIKKDYKAALDYLREKYPELFRKIIATYASTEAPANYASMQEFGAVDEDVFGKLKITGSALRAGDAYWTSIVQEGNPTYVNSSGNLEPVGTDAKITIDSDLMFRPYMVLNSSWVEEQNDGKGILQGATATIFGKKWIKLAGDKTTFIYGETDLKTKYGKDGSTLKEAVKRANQAFEQLEDAQPKTYKLNEKQFDRINYILDPANKDKLSLEDKLLLGYINTILAIAPALVSKFMKWKESGQKYDKETEKPTIVSIRIPSYRDIATFTTSSTRTFSEPYWTSTRVSNKDGVSKVSEGGLVITVNSDGSFAKSKGTDRYAVRVLIEFAPGWRRNSEVSQQIIEKLRNKGYINVAENIFLANNSLDGKKFDFDGAIIGVTSGRVKLTREFERDGIEVKFDPNKDATDGPIQDVTGNQADLGKINAIFDVKDVSSLSDDEFVKVYQGVVKSVDEWAKKHTPTGKSSMVEEIVEILKTCYGYVRMKDFTRPINLSESAFNKVMAVLSDIRGTTSGGRGKSGSNSGGKGKSDDGKRLGSGGEKQGDEGKSGEGDGSNSAGDKSDAALNDLQKARNVLGVDKNASDADIKKAYRSLAKKYHPDTKSRDKDVAGRIFKIVNIANQILNGGSDKLSDDDYNYFMQHKDDMLESCVYTGYYDLFEDILNS